MSPLKCSQVSFLVHYRIWFKHKHFFGNCSIGRVRLKLQACCSEHSSIPAASSGANKRLLTTQFFEEAKSVKGRWTIQDWWSLSSLASTSNSRLLCLDLPQSEWIGIIKNCDNSSIVKMRFILIFQSHLANVIMCFEFLGSFHFSHKIWNLFRV
jgi:hypothetical protein